MTARDDGWESSGDRAQTICMEIWRNVSLNGCQKRYRPEVPFDSIICDNERKTVQIYSCLFGLSLVFVDRVYGLGGGRICCSLV